MGLNLKMQKQFSSFLPLTIRLKNFEGPLDLFIYLIQMHELHISQVYIQQVTHQYLASLSAIQKLDFDRASECLMMIVTLLYWKSKILFPEEKVIEEEPILPNPIFSQNLQPFLIASILLNQLPQLGRDVFHRANEKPPIKKLLKKMQISKLALSYQTFLSRSRKMTQVLKKETVSIQEKIEEFSQKLSLGKPMPLSYFFPPSHSKSQIIAAFLASLELSRLGKLRLYQAQPHAMVTIELLEDIKESHIKSKFEFKNLPL